MKRWIVVILTVHLACIGYAQTDTSNVIHINDMGDRMQLKIGDSVVEFTYEEMYAYYLQRGVEVANHGDYQAAISEFNLALLYLTTDAQAFYNRGLAYYMLQEYSTALEDFDRAIVMDTTYADAYQQRGITRCLMGETLRSLPDFEKAIALKPGECRNYHNLGIAYLQLGEVTKACAYLHQALDLGYAQSASTIETYCGE